MKIEDAQKLLEKYVTGATLIRHCKTVAAAMRYWAEKSGGKDPEFWECAGLLHDIDFEKYPEQHCVKAKEILEAEKSNFPGITDELIHAVQSHGWNICSDVKPESHMEKVLYTVDELTGLIFACAMARPSKSVMDMEVKSVAKKFKTLKFAEGCNREVIKAGADMLGMDMNDVISNCILAMRERHEELGV